MSLIDNYYRTRQPPESPMPSLAPSQVIVTQPATPAAKPSAKPSPPSRGFTIKSQTTNFVASEQSSSSTQSTPTPPASTPKPRTRRGKASPPSQGESDSILPSTNLQALQQKWVSLRNAPEPETFLAKAYYILALLEERGTNTNNRM